MGVGAGLVRGLVVTAVVAGAAGCSGGGSHGAVAVRHVTYGYSCCVATDIDLVRHPGDVLALHWIVTESTDGPGQASAPVTLSASLTGSFPDVTSLKRSPAAAKSLAAPVIHTTTWTGGTPTSWLQIPATATPGLYNLATQVSSGGATFAGGAIVQVTAKK